MGRQPKPYFPLPKFPPRQPRGRGESSEKSYTPQRPSYLKSPHGDTSVPQKARKAVHRKDISNDRGVQERPKGRQERYTVCSTRKIFAETMKASAKARSQIYDANIWACHLPIIRVAEDAQGWQPFSCTSIEYGPDNPSGFAGEKVAWNWGSSTVEGEVAEKKAEKVREPYTGGVMPIRSKASLVQVYSCA